MMGRAHAVAAAAAALALAGCWNKPVDVGIGMGALAAKPSGQAEQSAQASTGTYAILDLTSGAVTTATTVADLAGNTGYRTGQMVFKAVEDGTGPKGSPPGQFGAQPDEASGVTSVRRYYLGVFEVTQAQWRLLAGTTPWTTAGPSTLVASGDLYPAVGMSRSQAAAVAGSAGARFAHTLALPTSDQWEHACRAGSAAAFSWGDARDDGTVRTSAVTVEVIDGVNGARTVGGRQANLMGFFDMHGNVWEYTGDGPIRGGSWRDTLSQARSANRGPALDPEYGHPLVGFRLVLTP